MPGLRCVATCCMGSASPHAGPRFGSAHPCSTCPCCQRKPREGVGHPACAPSARCQLQGLISPTQRPGPASLPLHRPSGGRCEALLPVGGGREAEGETYQVAVQRCLHARSIRRRRYPAVRELSHVVQPADELLQLAAEHLLNKARQKVLVICFSNKEEAAAGIHGRAAFRRAPAPCCSPLTELAAFAIPPCTQISLRSGQQKKRGQKKRHKAN